jgi:hypothetical protein
MQVVESVGWFEIKKIIKSCSGANSKRTKEEGTYVLILHF